MAGKLGNQLVTLSLFNTQFMKALDASRKAFVNTAAGMAKVGGLAAATGAAFTTPMIAGATYRNGTQSPWRLAVSPREAHCDALITIAPQGEAAKRQQTIIVTLIFIRAAIVRLRIIVTIFKIAAAVVGIGTAIATAGAVLAGIISVIGAVAGAITTVVGTVMALLSNRP